MAITLKRIIDKLDKNYHMKIVASESALDNIVQWVHSVEDIEVTEFLRGNEVVFTTGIRQMDLVWMLPFAEKLYKNGASAWVVNIGPYIKSVPEEICEFCLSHNLPLLIVPWDVRLVDMTREFCNQIIQSEQNEMRLTTAIRNAIFQPQHEESYLPVLTRWGFEPKDKYAMLAINILAREDLKEQSNTLIDVYIDTYLTNIGVKHMMFLHHGIRIVIILNSEDQWIKEIGNQLIYLIKSKSDMLNITVSSGLNRKGIETLPFNFKKTIETLKLAIKREKSFLCYDCLGIDKLLLSMDDEISAKEFYDENLGKLEAYDQRHHTEYLVFLKRYLDCDCNIKAIAAQDFIHRNTVHYHLNKIKSIISCDFNNLEDKLKLLLAYHIRNVI